MSHHNRASGVHADLGWAHQEDFQRIQSQHNTYGGLRNRPALIPSLFDAVGGLSDLKEKLKARETKWQRFLRVVFGIVKARKGVQGSRLIHPSSPFSQVLIFMTSILLMYTAVVFPVVIAFLWKEPACSINPLLWWDVFVDTYFLIDVTLNFFIGLEQKGQYIDDHKKVVLAYLRGGFLFDIITSVPLSYLEVAAMAACSRDEEGPEIKEWKLLRLIKPLRTVRLLRVLRAFKSIEFTGQIEAFVQAPPVSFRLLRVLIAILSITHLAACGFWLTKVLSTEEEDIATFLIHNGVEGDAGLTKRYILAMYFINTIFTTVGFGDIHANNTSEQLACIVIMLAGAVVFGTLLSEVEITVEEVRKMSRMKGQLLGEVKDFMHRHEMPDEITRGVIKWIDFDFEVGINEEQESRLLSRLKPPLQIGIHKHMMGNNFHSVSFIEDLDHPLAQTLQAELWSQMTQVLFEKGEEVAQVDRPATYMLIVQKGEIRVEDEDGTICATHRKGECVGEWALLGETDITAEYGFPVLHVAARHTICYQLQRAAFEEVLMRYPREVKDQIANFLEDRREMLSATDEGEPTSRSYKLAAARWNAMFKKLMKGKKKEQKGSASNQLMTKLKGATANTVQRSSSVIKAGTQVSSQVDSAVTSPETRPIDTAPEGAAGGAFEQRRPSVASDAGKGEDVGWEEFSVSYA